MDKIYIKDLTLKAHHGVLPEEKEKGQNFILDITVTADLKKAREKAYAIVWNREKNIWDRPKSFQISAQQKRISFFYLLCYNEQKMKGAKQCKKTNAFYYLINGCKIL